MSGADLIKSHLCGVEAGLALRRFVNLTPHGVDTDLGMLIYPTGNGQCNIGITVGNAAEDVTQYQSVQTLGEVEVVAGEAIAVGDPVIGMDATGYAMIATNTAYAIGFAIEEATASGDHILVVLVGPWVTPIVIG